MIHHSEKRDGEMRKMISSNEHCLKDFKNAWSELQISSAELSLNKSAGLQLCLVRLGWIIKIWRSDKMVFGTLDMVLGRRTILSSREKIFLFFVCPSVFTLFLSISFLFVFYLLQHKLSLYVMGGWMF